MPLLGAIIAGGASQRFGRDKAIEQVGGQPLIEAVVAALAGQTDALVICGRRWREITALKDHPSPDLGPLGGINAALHQAMANGFSGILCMPVDVHPAPKDVARQLAGATLTVFAEQILIGFWPAAFAAALDAYLQDGKRSVRGFLEQEGAKQIADPPGLININRPDDLDKLKRR